MINENRKTLRFAQGAIAAALVAAAATTVAIAASQGAAGKADPKAPAKPEATITLTTKPTPPVGGENEFTVSVKDSAGKPVVGADVSVLLLMPAMPAMHMPEMKNTVALKPAEGKDATPGTYIGRGQVPMAGRWNVTVSVNVGGRDFAEKQLTLTAK